MKMFKTKGRISQILFCYFFLLFSFISINIFFPNFYFSLFLPFLSFITFFFIYSLSYFRSSLSLHSFAHWIFSNYFIQYLFILTHYNISFRWFINFSFFGLFVCLRLFFQFFPLIQIELQRIQGQSNSVESLIVLGSLWGTIFTNSRYVFSIDILPLLQGVRDWHSLGIP